MTAVTKPLVVSAGINFSPASFVRSSTSAVRFTPVVRIRKRPATTVSTRAPSLPTVERFETKRNTCMPQMLMMSKMTMRQRKPRVTLEILLVSRRKIWSAVFTTPVAMTPQAMLAATKRVVPT